MPEPYRIPVKVVPNARCDEVIGWSAGELRVKVRAPALEGRANDAVCELLAGHLGLPGRAVRLVRGEKSRSKLLEISGPGAEAARGRLGTPPVAAGQRAAPTRARG